MLKYHHLLYDRPTICIHTDEDVEILSHPQQELVECSLDLVYSSDFDLPGGHEGRDLLYLGCSVQPWTLPCGEGTNGVKQCHTLSNLTENGVNESIN